MRRRRRGKNRMTKTRKEKLNGVGGKDKKEIKKERKKERKKEKLH